jgi:ribose 5-phosphate isomerase B
MEKEIVLIGSDHAGFEMKEILKSYLSEQGIPFNDAGAKKLDPDDDYPVFASKVAAAIGKKEYNVGIVLCGTGIGASIAANRHKGVRAALCTSAEMAVMARKHNDANVLVLGGRTTSVDLAKHIIDAWFKTDFEGERHGRRVQQLDELTGSCD